MGYGNLFHNINVVNMRTSTILMQRLRDQYVQEWHNMVSNQSKLEYYCMFKTDFIYEKYLDDIKNVKLKTQLTRFRLCSHSLEIETGRYNGIERNDRKCKLCNQNTVESEYHFMLCCPTYTEIRRKYKITANWPNIALFRNILASQNTISIMNVARFISEGMKLRDETLNTIDGT